MEIIRNATIASTMAPASSFTGNVRIDAPFRWPAPSRMGGATVTFEPGGRTAWHTNPWGKPLSSFRGGAGFSGKTGRSSAYCGPSQSRPSLNKTAAAACATSAAFGMSR